MISSVLKNLFRELPKYFNRDFQTQDVFEMTLKTSVNDKYVTIKDGNLYIHEFEFDETREEEMEIIDLMQFTINQLKTRLEQDYFNVSLIDDSYNDRLAVLLEEVSNIAIEMGNFVDIKIVKSKNFEILIPISVILSRSKTDVQYLLKQMYLNAASGAWLDYWGQFFGVKRKSGEIDSIFSRRIFLKCFNPKTNNVAMEEYLSNLFETDVTVEDIEPLKFNVVTTPSVLSTTTSSQFLQEIINSIRPYGVFYTLFYQESFQENYRTYFTDKNGTDFKNSETATLQGKTRDLNKAIFLNLGIGLNSSNNFLFGTVIDTNIPI